MIRLEKVNKYFNRHKANQIHVIDNTSLELPESGIVTLLGASGSGKTTLLNAIGGLDRVNSGSIFVDGQRITRRRSGRIDTIRNANIGYIFQNFNLMDVRRTAPESSHRPGHRQESEDYHRRRAHRKSGQQQYA